MSKKWIFIIDTDEYAGNFERDMCAYVTGQIGDCGVGDDFSALYNEEVKDGPDFDSFIESRPDDNGCCRPCQCWPTKGWLSVGHDKAVRKEDWNQAEADAAYQKESAEIYRGYRRQVERVQPGEKGYESWTQEAKDRELARHDKEIARALKEKSPKWEPNNSVAIFFYKKPTDEMVKLMKERAYKFVEAKRKNAEKEDISWEKKFKLTIHGFRLIEETTKKKSKEI